MGAPAGRALRLRPPRPSGRRRPARSRAPRWRRARARSGRGARRPPRGRRSRRAGSRPGRAPAPGSRSARAGRRPTPSSGRSRCAAATKRRVETSRATSARPVRQCRRASRRKPARADRVADVAERDVPAPVPLAREREDGVRAEPDLAVGTRRRVDPEERERRVGDRVDEPADEVPPLGPEREVVAPERDDPRLGRRPAQQRRGDPRARLRRRPPVAASSVPPVVSTTVAPPRRASPTTRRAEQELASLGDDVRREGVGDPGEVDDGGAGRVERLDAGDARLELTEPLGPDQLDAGHAVRDGPAVQLGEPRPLGLVGRDDHLPAAEDRDPPLVAVPEQALRALDAQPRLERSGRVVDAAVHDAARAPGLVAGDAVLLLDEREPEARAARLQLPRDREPEDPASDDDRVVARHRRPAAGAPTSACTRGRSRPRAG